MPDPSTKPSPTPATPAAPPAGVRLLGPMQVMVRAFWASPQRNKILLLGLAIVAVIGVTAFGQVRLNAWNKPFYDALAHKNISVFIEQLWVFGELAGFLLILNVAQTWLNQKSKLVLRKGLIDDLMTQWLLPLRAFRLSHAGAIGENPDQRIHEDAGGAEKGAHQRVDLGR